MKNKGFTLIELLIVVAIISILVSIPSSGLDWSDVPNGRIEPNANALLCGPSF